MSDFQFLFATNHKQQDGFNRLTIDKLTSMAKSPRIGAKESAPLFAPHNGKAKTKPAALAAQFGALIIDFDDGTHDKEAIRAAFDDVAFLAWTSSSHTPDAPRWKVVIPLSQAIGADDWLPLAVGAALVHGTDMAQARISQACYLPNKLSKSAPYDFIDNLGAPAFEPTGARAQRYLAAYGEHEAERERFAEAATIAPRNVSFANGESIISMANRAYDVHSLLTANGYTRRGKKYLAPNSQSGEPGVYVLANPAGGERVYSHHTHDVLADGHAHDAFDLLVLFRFGGDVSEAVKTLANELDADGQKQRQRDYMAKQDAMPVIHVQAHQPRPLPQVERMVDELDSSMLPDVIWRFVADTADRQQSPADFVAIAGLCALSGVIGRKVMIQPKQRDVDWRIVPNLWGALIGKPSAMKTPTLKAATSPLDALEAAAREAFADENIAAKVNAAMAAMQAEEHTKKAKKTADEVAARHHLEEAIRAEEAAKAVIKPRRLIVQDATVEKLGELLNENPNGLTVIRDELSGWIARLNAADSGDERAFYLEAYNGDGGYTFDRIARGTIHISSLTVAVIGGIQPSKLAPLVKSAANGQADDGLIQRFQLAVWPRLSETWEWRDRTPCPRAKGEYTALFRRLDAMPRYSPEDNAATPIMRLDEDAQGLFSEWSIDLHNEIRSQRNISSSLEAHLVKMPTTVNRLACIFALVEQHNEVTGQDMARALAMSDYLRSHAEKIYGLAMDSPIESAHMILQRRDKLPETFTAREIQRKGWTGIYSADDASEALSVLAEYGWVTAQSIATTEAGGRPTTVYRFAEAAI